MLHAIEVAFFAVFPLICMMIIGFILRLLKLLNDDNIKHMNNLCFKVFLPSTLFYNIYTSDFATAFNSTLIIYTVICVFIMFIFVNLLVPKIEKDNKKRAVMAQGSFRSNFAIYGVLIVGTLFGEEGTAVAAIITAFAIPFFNILSVVALQKYCDKKSGFAGTVFEVLKNPLIIACALAFIFILLNIKLPVPVLGVVEDLTGVTTPFALILIGGGFKFTSTKKYFKQLSITVVSKLILMPLFFVPFAIFLGISGIQLVTLLILFASPTAVSSYTMAQSAGANHELAGQIVVYTTILSVFTIFLYLTIFSYFGLIVQ